MICVSPKVLRPEGYQFVPAGDQITPGGNCFWCLKNLSKESKKPIEHRRKILSHDELHVVGHADCIYEAIQETQKCPICKLEVDVSSVTPYLSHNIQPVSGSTDLLSRMISNRHLIWNVNLFSHGKILCNVMFGKTLSEADLNIANLILYVALGVIAGGNIAIKSIEEGAMQAEQQPSWPKYYTESGREVRVRCRRRGAYENLEKSFRTTASLSAMVAFAAFLVSRKQPSFILNGIAAAAFGLAVGNSLAYLGMETNPDEKADKIPEHCP